MTKEREILQKLVDLKDHKDKYGKDEHYKRQQPLLWEMARKTLASSKQVCSHPDKYFVSGVFGGYWCPKCDRNVDDDCE